MSWHFLQGQEAASWVGPSLDGAPSALLRLIPTPGASCLPGNATDGCRDFPSGMTSKPSTDTRGEASLTSCQVVFRAKTFPAQEKGLESKEVEAGCGNTWRELSARYDRVACGWRTHRCLFDAALPWSLVTLPRWGMMRSGVLWERTTPGLLTSGTGFGFWPTPRAGNPGSRPNGKGGKILAEEVEIAEGLRARMFRTPNAADADKWSNDTKEERESMGRQVMLCHQLQAGGQLNPNWVEWLMGWPIGWTDCAASATDKSPRPWPWRGQS